MGEEKGVLKLKRVFCFTNCTLKSRWGSVFYVVETSVVLKKRGQVEIVVLVMQIKVFFLYLFPYTIFKTVINTKVCEDLGTKSLKVHVFLKDP